MAGGFWIYGGALIVIAVILVIIFAIGLTRSTNVRRRATEVSQTPNVPHDPTISKRADDVEDTEGNFTRSTPFKQDAGMGKADRITDSERL
jgi:hypothetical protein